MVEQPSGTVTLVFTDIEGSTRLLQELGQEAYRDALAAHRRVVREAFVRHAGYEVDYEGDAFFYVFASAGEAVAAVEEALHELEPGPIRLRVGIHTGEPGLDPPKYVGLDVHLAARVMAAGHGGQVLLTRATADLLTSELKALGEHRLRDITAPVDLYQLGDRHFPPPKSLSRTNLPLAANPLLGREEELRQIRRLVEEGVRVITLTGAGGSGKTRLAIAAAAELLDDFTNGVFFVALAPVEDAQLVNGAVAQALGLSPDDDITARLRRDRLLLVLDNVEHLDGIGDVVPELLVGGVVIIATGRTPLHLAAEHEVPVEPLPDAAAIELFVARSLSVGARVAPDDSVRALCRRVDKLPLAVELAAARTKHLAPAAVLERLDRALPLLTGGPRDAPARQQTLRATIEWSHDLLDADERAAFRRIAVFRGGCALDAAESVCGADLDQLASLVDQSLLQAIGDDRFQMLETIREYALERLDETGERDEIAHRHALFYLRRLEEMEPVLRGPRTPEFLAWFDAEVQNLWASLDTFLEAGEVEHALTLAGLLAPFWVARRGMSEGVRWLENALARTEERSVARGRALDWMADLFLHLGDPEAGEAAAREAIDIATEFDDERGLCDALLHLSWIERERGSDDQAIALARSALDRARATGDETFVWTAASQLANALNRSGRDLDEARRLQKEALEFRRRVGDQVNAATELLNLGGVEIARGDYLAARRHLDEALAIAQEVGAAHLICPPLVRLGLIALLSGDHQSALERFVESLESAIETHQGRGIVFALEGIAFAAAESDVGAALRIHGAMRTIRAMRGMQLSRSEADTYSAMFDRLRELAGTDRFESELAAGADLSLDQAIELARMLSSAVVQD